MAVLRNSVLDWLTQRRALRRWRMSARQASSFSFKDLRKERAAARKLRHELNELIAVADHRLALPVQRVNVRVRCQAPARPPAPAPLAGGDGAPAWEARLPGVDTPVPVYRRDNLASGQALRGPALVFEAVGTVYLAPGWRAQVHSEGHLLLTR